MLLSVIINVSTYLYIINGRPLILEQYVLDNIPLYQLMHTIEFTLKSDDMTILQVPLVFLSEVLTGFVYPHSRFSLEASM